MCAILIQLYFTLKCGGQLIPTGFDQEDRNHDPRGVRTPEIGIGKLGLRTAINMMSKNFRRKIERGRSDVYSRCDDPQNVQTKKLTL